MTKKIKTKIKNKTRTKQKKKNKKKKQRTPAKSTPGKDKDKSKKVDDKAQHGQRRKRIERKKGAKSRAQCRRREKKRPDRPRQGPKLIRAARANLARLYPPQSDKANQTTAAPKPSRRKLGAHPVNGDPRSARALTQQSHLKPGQAERRRNANPQAASASLKAPSPTKRAFAFRVAGQADRKPHI